MRSKAKAQLEIVPALVELAPSGELVTPDQAVLRTAEALDIFGGEGAEQFGLRAIRPRHVCLLSRARREPHGPVDVDQARLAANTGIDRVIVGWGDNRDPMRYAVAGQAGRALGMVVGVPSPGLRLSGAAPTEQQPDGPVTLGWHLPGIRRSTDDGLGRSLPSHPNDHGTGDDRLASCLWIDAVEQTRHFDAARMRSASATAASGSMPISSAACRMIAVMSIETDT